MTSVRSIVVAFASVGSGPRVAAEALAAEISSQTDGAVTAHLVDLFDHGALRSMARSATEGSAGRRSQMAEAAWNSPVVSALARAVLTPLMSAVSGDFVRAIDAHQPSAVVATQPVAAAMVARASSAGRLNAHLVDVATDFSVSSFWPKRGVSLFCVADEPSGAVALERGFDSSAVAITGIPVRSQFTLEYDREAARRHFGLPADKRVLLALAGSTRPGPYRRFTESLAVSLPALASLPETTVAVVCGADDRLAEELKVRAKGFGTTNVHVFGYVQHMAPLMACAEIALARPGGEMCAECLAMGIPLVLAGPSAGQDGANARALVEAGAAVYAADPRTIAEHARKALSRPARLKVMRDAAVSLGRPYAAYDVIERVLALTGWEPAPAPPTVPEHAIPIA